MINMPLCKNCQHELGEEKYCPICGARNDNFVKAKPSTAQPPPPPPPPSPTDATGKTPPRKIIDIEVDEDDITEGVETAKRGIGSAIGLAKKGVSKGVELASKGAQLAGKGVDTAREAISERQAPPTRKAKRPSLKKSFCPNCGEAITGTSKFCSNCGQKLE